MPRIYRVMLKAADDGPTVGQSAAQLGVRVPTDIAPDEQDRVSPGTGGMSVSPGLRALPAFLIPKRLRALVPKARGRDDGYVWRMGTGPFTRGSVGEGLQLEPDSPTHGTVQPAEVMPLSAYEDALAATRDEWVIDETGS
jgi:hypothetical protein